MQSRELSNYAQSNADEVSLWFKLAGGHYPVMVEREPDPPDGRIHHGTTTPANPRETVTEGTVMVVAPERLTPVEPSKYPITSGVSL